MAECGRRRGPIPHRPLREKPLIDVYRKIFDILDRRERRNLVILIGLMLVMGAVDVIGVASVLPFLAVVSDPSAVETNRYLSTLYELSGVTEVWSFLVLLGIAAFLFVLLSNVTRALTVYSLARFNRMRSLSLSMRLMERYLGQPYLWFLNRHSSDLAKTILTEVTQVVNGPLNAAMQTIAHGVVTSFLVIFLLVLEPAAALGAGLLFGLSYGLIFMLARRKLTELGQERVRANRDRFKVVQEAMGGIKTVKLMDLEKDYLRRYRSPAGRLAQILAALSVLQQLPRYFLEVIAFGGIILFVLWLLATRSGEVSEIIPILGVYAFAAARMFPSIQKLFQSISSVRFGRPALDNLHQELTGPPPGDIGRGPPVEPIRLRHRLQLENVRFSFPGMDRPALDDVGGGASSDPQAPARPRPLT